MFSKNKPIVLFLDRHGFSLFQESLSNIARLNFSPETVANLDVINKEGLLSLINSFIESNKVASSDLIVVLSEDVMYEKDLQKSKSLPNQKSDEENRESQIQNFLGNVPFEEVLARVIKIENLERLIAINKDLTDSIIDPFVKKGSFVEGIVPSFMYGKSVSFANGLSRENASVVIRKPEILKLGNLLTNQKTINSNEGNSNLPENKKEEKPHKNLRQYLLIGVFLVLLVVLGIVVVLTLPSKDQNLSIAINPSGTPTKPLEPSNSLLRISDIKVTIIDSKELSRAKNLRTELLKIGFKDISEDSSSSASENSSILFSKNIPVNIRQRVISGIGKILLDIVTQEDQNSDSNIRILVGRS